MAMEKSSQSSATATATATADDSSPAAAAGAASMNINNRANMENCLRNLNKASIKISKPSTSAINKPFISTSPNVNPSPNPTPLSPPQPPVYTINKDDFRDVVQRLTGSPVHPPAQAVTSPAGQPAQPVKPTAVSRLHRIRPPPLAPPRPPLVSPSQLSPLPPLPTVSAASESPITAYMRRLRAGEPSPLSFGGGCAVPLLSPTFAASLPTSPGPVPSPR